MPQRTLWKVTVATLPEAEEVVAETLSTLFKEPAASYTDLRTGVTRVSSFHRRKPRFGSAERKALVEAFDRFEESGFDLGPRTMSLKQIRNRDWAESWKKHFKPIEIGNRLLIKPTWSGKRTKRGQVAVILDPGLSFGTGQHPTTAFCLRQLVSFAHRQVGPLSFLDIGTGSGILAIAAVKLGFSRVKAIDHDPQAVRVARQNMQMNRILPKIRLCEQDATGLARPAKEYDLVCANLISNVLVQARDQIIGQVRPGGVLVLAGILAPEFQKVATRYIAAGLKMLRQRREKEWCSGSFIRN